MTFEFDPPKVAGVNRAVIVNCKTCNGDRMVAFNTRTDVSSGWMQRRGLKAKGAVDEYAPCPDCNPTCDTRRRGFKSPDLARVRQKLRTDR